MRVQDEVQKNLLELVLVAHDFRQLVGELETHLDARAHELMLQQRQDVSDHVVELDRHEARTTLAREVEQVVHDLRCALGLSLDLVEKRRLGITSLGLILQHLGKAADAGERRVDFVGHAGGQEAKSRHLLLELKLGLELDPCGDVLEDHDRPLGLLLLGDERRNLKLDDFVFVVQVLQVQPGDATRLSPSPPRLAHGRDQRVAK